MDMTKVTAELNRQKAVQEKAEISVVAGVISHIDRHGVTDVQAKRLALVLQGNDDALRSELGTGATEADPFAPNAADNITVVDGTNVVGRVNAADTDAVNQFKAAGYTEVELNGKRYLRKLAALTTTPTPPAPTPAPAPAAPAGVKVLDAKGHPKAAITKATFDANVGSFDIIVGDVANPVVVQEKKRGFRS